MKTVLAWICCFPFLILSPNAIAQDKTPAPKEDPAYSEKAFSDQLTDGYNYLGLDWSPWTGLAAIQGHEVIPLDKSFVSPDKKFSVQTTLADGVFYIVIKDLQTGSTTRLSYDYCPVFALDWSPDSQTVLTVGHTSMSSLIVLIHWNGHKWQALEVDGPNIGTNDKAHVVNWSFKANYTQATYIVNNRTDKGTSIDLYKCTCRINPTNGQTSEVVKKKISQKEFIALRTNRN